MISLNLRDASITSRKVVLKPAFSIGHLAAAVAL